ncbi:hypothetical protein CRE_05142 [Caenorhabditis remanei]|uniref:CDP-diacylglycerol--inositol 3-phosphatidyltransferase n=1 Tax=Caenorhabditis remanei TaxID=31234 RepID=E3N6A5_CAERE|nr:hypothetical protein CRE_05142 [Caenorhabditis remanei]
MVFGIEWILKLLSAGLDAFDGWAARKNNQSSRFGAMLDQLTDRCGTLALVMALCKFFPDHLFFLQLSAVIDIASHWLHIHATDLSGASHEQSTNWLLNLYYTDRMLLGFMCRGNFYILLYIRAFWAGPFIFGSFHFMSIFPLIAFPVGPPLHCRRNGRRPLRQASRRGHPKGSIIFSPKSVSKKIILLPAKDNKKITPPAKKERQDSSTRRPMNLICIKPKCSDLFSHTIPIWNAITSQTSYFLSPSEFYTLISSSITRY